MANVAGPSAFVGKVSVMLRHSGTRAVARATSGSRPSSRRAGASTRAPPVARSPGAEPGPPRDHEDKRRPRPQADDVVPVEVARLAAEAATEDRHAAQRSSRPVTRPPQIE